MAVKAIYDCLKHMRDDGALTELSSKEASPDLLRLVNQTDEFVRWPSQVCGVIAVANNVGIA